MLIVLPLKVDLLLPGDHAPDDLDVLPGAGERLVRRLAVPALDDLGARDAEAEVETTVGQVVDRQRVHGGGGRGAGGQLGDGGTQLDLLGDRCQIGEGAEGI